MLKTLALTVVWINLWDDWSCQNSKALSLSVANADLILSDERLLCLEIFLERFLF